ncbi:MAG: hypothetical protein NTZ50_12480 [Chloroflexi bacterium]|nr:hypothetical protein [Chloroflexota bacterium]
MQTPEKKNGETITISDGLAGLYQTWFTGPPAQATVLTTNHYDRIASALGLLPNRVFL